MKKNLKELLAQKLTENTLTHKENNIQSHLDFGGECVNIPLSIIEPNPYQPRKIFDPDEIEVLAQSISETGLLQPIVLREVNQIYQIIAGERRWRAHKLLGKKYIRAIIISAHDNEMALFALVENLMREDLSDYEIGKALRRIESMFSTKKDLAKAVGMDRADMYAYFSFESLPESIVSKLEANPSLLSRTAAKEMKMIIQSYNSTEILFPILDEAIALLENNLIKQTNLATYVKKKLNGIGTDCLSKNKKITFPLTKDGLFIGTVIKNNNSFVVKISTSSLSDEKENQLINSLKEIFKCDV